MPEVAAASGYYTNRWLCCRKELFDMRCTIIKGVVSNDGIIKDCACQETCCQECGYEDCMEGCELFDAYGGCEECEYCED